MSIGPKFIGLCGPKHGGKDTVAQMIIDRDPRYLRVAFADIMKRMALAMDPYVLIFDSIEWEEELWTFNELLSVRRLPGAMHDDWYHTTTLGLSELVAHVGWEKAKEVKDVRRFLQSLGTEGGRNCLGPDIWVDATFRQSVFPFLDPVGHEDTYIPDARFVFTDVRFTNEIAAVRGGGYGSGGAAQRKGGELWRIDRPDAEDGDPHPSEREWREATPDWVIENHEGLDELRASVDALVPYHPA